MKTSERSFVTMIPNSPEQIFTCVTRYWLLLWPNYWRSPRSYLYQIPFAALSDKGGEYLSEAFGLRIVPSLTTLKLVLDSSHEYHRHTNALIMADPVVGEVIYKERSKNITPLPCAKGETKMLWRLFLAWYRWLETAQQSRMYFKG